MTVAEVAAAAGVSKVTVFAHFRRKEDLFLDRAPEAAALLQATVHDRPPGSSPPLWRSGGSRSSLRTSATRCRSAARRRAVPAHDGVVAGGGVPRPRLGSELEPSLADALAEVPQPAADTALLAALVVASYRSVVTVTAAQVLAGDPSEIVSVAHRQRLQRAFGSLDAGAAALARGG